MIELGGKDPMIVDDQRAKVARHVDAAVDAGAGGISLERWSYRALGADVRQIPTASAPVQPV